ncbi:hypothetical protein RhiirA4_469977 [Rhizophagus irregularis]|uniref:Uncharacterized protein n=1 Tax=Rhizophagus irregularis TaxID=588596 RepID=A0A2I1H0H5_9GLOM|nr:hypothetical protein RhiirA4_469977 [Rhizophagus irregularis]
MDNIIQETKEFFEGACNSLLINADKDPIIDDELINKMTFWDQAYSESKLTFIDLIKGIIPCELMFETKRKGKRLKIILKKVKENYKEEYIDPNRKVDILNLFNGLESLQSNIYFVSLSALIWKNEMLNSKKLEDLFYYNFKGEFDWNRTLQFISNRNKYKSREIDNDDVWEQSYKIKNFLKDLPTYEILYKREVNEIDTDQCIRCKNGVEDWDHIWTCEANELTIKEVIEQSIMDFEDTLLKVEKHGKVLYEKSEVYIGKEKYWELIRGVYNNKFNKISKDKEEKELVNELWNFIFEALKKEFWLKRCNEVNEIERKLNVTKADKRIRKLKDRDLTDDKKIDNHSKN